MPLTALATLLVFQAAADAQPRAARFTEAESPKLLWAVAQEGRVDAIFDNYLVRPVSLTTAGPGCCKPPSLMPSPDPTGPSQTDPGTSPDDVFVPPSQSVLGTPSRIAATGSNGGYIDTAIPRSQFRFRFDSNYGANRPDRAEFIYPACGCFRGSAAGNDAPGPSRLERRIDYQETMAYFEYATSDRFSIFTELGMRFLNPVVNDNASGLGDMRAGFKYALVAKPDEYFTFQLKTYIPSGDAFKGLGVEHWSVEPGLLYYKKLSRKLTLEAEFRDWIPINGTNLPIAGVGDYAGSVLRYGVGLGYTVYDGCNYRIAPVAELVGWSVLDGRTLNGDTGAIENAAGDTIVNMKLGVRVSTGTRRLLPAGDTQSLYIGYGHALTGDRWYRDILRVEYRILF